MNPELVAAADEAVAWDGRTADLAVLKKGGLTRHAGDFDRDIMVEEEPHSSELIGALPKNRFPPDDPRNRPATRKP